MATQQNLSVRKAAEELVQAICLDTSASAVSVTRDSLSELKHIHGISDKINAAIDENSALLVKGNDKVYSAVLDLKESNDKVLSALVDVKNAIVSNTRLQALHWAMTYVKTSQPDETVGNFTYLSELPDRSGIRVELVNSKDLALKILLSFVQGLGHIVEGYVGVVDQWGRCEKQSDDAKAKASALFKKKLSDQMKQITGLDTKYVPQSDGRVAIFLAV